MKRTTKRIIAGCLCAALLTGGAFTALALNGGKTGPTPTQYAPTQETPVSDIPAAAGKDETVYILAAADGSPKKIIVSDKLRNTEGAGAVSDRSELSGIENVTGDETFREEDGSLVWDAAGEDICYQGGIEKETPVNIRVSYRLDGREISPEELAGQSGRVSIRFDYENRQFDTALIDGKRERIAVPFAVLTGLLLDNEVFRNIEVTNGKLLDDGDRCAVVGLALPGLQESLGLDPETLRLPDFLEITADVSGFRLGMTLTVATAELFSGLDLSMPDSLTELTERLEGLTDSLAELSDGMGLLCDGAETLLDGSTELADGIGQLSDGLNTLNENSAALKWGARQVFDSLVNTANEQLAASGLEIPALTRQNYASVLNGAIGSLNEESVTAAARQQVEAAVRAQTETVRAAVTAAVRAELEPQVTAAVRQSVLAQILAAKGISEDTYSLLPEEQRALLEAAADERMTSPEVTALTEAKTEEQLSSETLAALIEAKTEEQIAALIEQNLASEAVQAQIEAGIGQAAAGAESLRGLKAQLDSYNSFYQGLLSYTAGVASAAEGAARLKDAMPAFVDGVTQLRDGLKQVLEGLNGADLDEPDLTGLFDRLNAVTEAAKGYRSFSGISEGTEGRLRFVWRTDEIG